MRDSAPGLSSDVPIRIAFGVNMEVGGSELNAVRVAEHLDPARFRIVAVCGNDGPLSERYRAAGIPVYRFPIPNLYGPSSLRMGLQLARLLRSQQIDVFHAHDVYSNIFGNLYARLAGVPATIASRRWLLTVPRPGLNRLNRWFSRRATCVLANSPSLARMVEDEEGVPRERVVVVPNFLEDSAFVPLSRQDRATVLREIGVPVNAPVVGCVANLNPVKDHQLLVRSAARLRSRHPEAHYVFFGEGQCRPHLESLAKELGISERIHLPGQWIRPWNLHGCFDVSVLCSTSEGFPNSIVEAMAAAKPVVATRVGGNVDAISDSETGLLVEAGGEDQLVAALDRLLSSSVLCGDLGSKAQDRARGRYTAGRVIPMLESLYEHLFNYGDCRGSVTSSAHGPKDEFDTCAE